MRNILIAVLGLAIVAGVTQANTLSLWVTKDAGNPGTPGDVPNDVAVNDVLTLWAAVEAGDKWIGINFDLGGTGDAAMSNDPIPTPFGTFFRWEASSDLTGSSVGLVAVQTLGLLDTDPFNVGGFAPLGTITALAGTGTARGTVGFARAGAIAGEDTIIIGADSVASDNNTDAGVLWTPEPASLVLIALAGLAIRRR